MSKVQGDNFRTWTDEELNNHRDNVFYPALVKAINEEIKVFDLGNDLTIVTIQSNITTHIGFKVNSIKVVGKRYRMYLYQDYGKDNGEVLMHSVVDNDKDKANQEFLRIKSMAF